MTRNIKKPLAYLAGAMENAPDNGSAWREEISKFIEDKLNHNVFNPCIEENHVLTKEELQHFREWKTSDLQRFRQVVHKIIKKDLTTTIEKVDYVVCLWDEYVIHGGGTHGELTMAYWHQIPVYMVSSIPLKNISSWIIGCTTEIFPDFSSLQKYLWDKFSKVT